MTGLPEEAKVHEVIVRAHQLLAEAPSVLVTATLEDTLAVEERPNMPSTTAEWPNWSLALPVPLGDMETQALTRAVANTLRRRCSPHGSRCSSTGAP
jgi:4-alpha-glucanotransferase